MFRQNDRQESTSKTMWGHKIGNLAVNNKIQEAVDKHDQQQPKGHKT